MRKPTADELLAACERLRLGHKEQAGEEASIMIYPTLVRTIPMMLYAPIDMFANLNPPEGLAYEDALEDVIVSMVAALATMQYGPQFLTEMQKGLGEQESDNPFGGNGLGSFNLNLDKTSWDA